MGVGMLGPYRFRIDPSSVTWDFSIKATDIKTVGGKVIQVFGTEFGDMQVTGSFGRGGRMEQAKMLQAMSKIGDEMMAGARTKASHQPIRFLYPPRNWDFRVYLKAFTQPGASVAARIAPETHAPMWTLTLFIAEDNGNVAKVAQDAYISRLAAGLGWKLTAFNGPVDLTTVGAKIAEAGSLEQYLTNNLILGTPPSGGTS